MERLTKTCKDGTHRAADNLPCGENSWDYKTLLLERLGAYEDTGLTPAEILDGKLLTGWIPVDERLPMNHDYERYLCTLDGELCGQQEPFTDMCGFENGEWDEPGCVIAWMPPPEPYRLD